MLMTRWRHCLQAEYLEKACTYKSNKTNVGTVYVTRDLDLWSFQPKISGFSGFIVEHLYVKFGDPSCIGF